MARSLERGRTLETLEEILRGHRAQYGIYCAIVVALGLVNLLPAEFLRSFTADIQALEDIGLRELVLGIAGFGATVALLLFISSSLTSYLQEWARLRLETRLRLRIMARVHQTSLPELDRGQRGDLLTRVTSDLFEAEDFLVGSIPRQLQSLGVAVGAALFVLAHSGPIGIFPLSTALVLVAVNLWTQQRLFPLLGELRNLHGGIFHQLIQSIEGTRTIRAHSAERQVEGRFEDSLGVISRKTLSMARLMGVLVGGGAFASQILMTGCLAFSAFALDRRQFELADVLVYPFFLGIFYDAVQFLAGATHDWNRFRVEGARLAELLRAPHGERSAPSERPPEENRIIENVERVHRVEISDLCFGHEGGPEVGPVCIQLARGRVVALMGPSGCGKTTLLEVIAGLRPWHRGRFALYPAMPDAEALWDSHDTLATSAPTGIAALVEQHPYIFEGTLRENLELGPNTSRETADLERAIDRAGLREFLNHSGGLDHFLHDRGQNLSEGERYRIALSRCLLAERPVLLLDEPFAALDAKSIEHVVETINLERATKAILIVTHQIPRGLRIDEQIPFFGGGWNRVRAYEARRDATLTVRSMGRIRHEARNFRKRHASEGVARRSDE